MSYLSSLANHFCGAPDPSFTNHLEPPGKGAHSLLERGTLTFYPSRIALYFRDQTYASVDPKEGRTPTCGSWVLSSPHPTLPLQLPILTSQSSPLSRMSWRP